jgi:hypothetical protein
VSVIPVTGWEILVRVARAFAITLTFVYIGALLEFALQEILFMGYGSLSGSGEATRGWTNNLSERIIWLALRPLAFWVGFSGPLALWVGLTGLIAGVYDAIFGRVNARTMLVISLVVALASLIFVMWTTPRAMDLYAHLHARELDLKAVWSRVAIAHFCFLVSVMACWKLIDIVRGKTPPAARGLTPT